MADKVNRIRLNSQDIDDILDEIHENEQNPSKKNNFIDEKDDIINWNEILQEIRNGNVNFIKNLITSNNIDINAQNPLNGMTLLLYSVIIGNYDLVKAICNFGADVKIKDNDGDDALNYAVKYGRYKITELIYYRNLSGSLGNDLRNISTEIHHKTKEAKDMMINEDRVSYSDLSENILEYMVDIIKKRKPFGKDLLFYAYYFSVKKKDPLQSFLWKSMMKTYVEILSNTSDKKGWVWLKRYFINSLIWYLPHPINKKNDNQDDGDDMGMDKILRQTLFYELLIRVRTESKKQSDLLLKEKIDKINTEKPNEWNKLISYNVNTKYSKNARQDICGCIIPKYNKNDLSENKYPPSTHFSAQKHYDTNIYLNELLFRANILNPMFQRDMKLITKDICMETGDEVIYRAGPVKTLTRSQTKVENDYINEDYPTSAKILDINRCALQFKTIESMMKFIQIFTDKINKNEAQSIVDIIRCKNGWSIYNPLYPQYTDIKFNVLVKSSNNDTIIAEIQCLLDLMSSFKKKAHKLYGVERKFDFVYNYGLLENKMSQFKDIGDINQVIINLTKQKYNLKYFKLLWNTIRPNKNTLIDIKTIDKNVFNTALFNIINENDEIDKYLTNKYPQLYLKTISNYIQTFCDKYGWGYYQFGNVFQHFAGTDKHNHEVASFFKMVIEKIIDLSDYNTNKVVKILVSKMLFIDIKNKKRKYKSFIYNICRNKNITITIIKAILNSKQLSDKNKMKLIVYKSDDICYFNGRLMGFPDVVFEIIKYFGNDRRQILNYLSQNVVVKMSNKGNQLNEYPVINHVCRQNSEKTLRYILYDANINMNDKFKLLSISSRYTCFERASKLKTKLVILRYFRNNRHKLINILKQANKEWIVEVCRGFYPLSIDIIRELLYNNNLSDKDKWEIFSVEDLMRNDVILNPNHYNALEIINYFDPERSKQNKKKLKKLININKLSVDTVINITSNYKMASFMKFVKYWRNDRIFLIKLFSKIGFEKVFKTEASLRYILYNTSLTDVDIINILFTKKLKKGCIKKKGMLILLLFFKNDRKYLLNLYSIFIKEKNSSFWSKIISIKPKNRKSKVIELLITGSALNIFDIFKIFNKCNGGVFYDAVIRNDVCWLFQMFEKKNKLNGKEYFCKLMDKIDQYLKSNEFDDYVKPLFTFINSDQMIHKLLKCFKHGKHGKLMVPFEDYLQFKQLLLSKNNIDIIFEQYTTEQNPFVTACSLGKYKTIQMVLESYDNNNNNTLKETKLSEILCNSAIYYAIVTNPTINDDPDLECKLFQLLILNSKFLSEKQKYNLLEKENQKIGQRVTLNTYLEILKHFKNNKKIFEKIIFYKLTKVKENVKKYPSKELIYIDIINFILNSSVISDKTKFKALITNHFIGIGYFFQHGLGSIIFDYFCNDKKLFRQLLHSEFHGSELQKHCPLWVLKESQIEDKLLLNKYVLNNLLISDKEKYELFIKMLAYSTDNEHIWFFSMIFNYLKDNHRDNLNKILCRKWEGSESNEYKPFLFRMRNEKIIKMVFEYIHSLNDELQTSIFAKDQIYLQRNTYIDRNILFAYQDNGKLLKAILSAANNHKIMRLYANQEIMRLCTDPNNHKRIILMRRYLDYTEFDELLSNEIDVTCYEYNKYSTNPFITSCYLGKYETINKLLNYVKNDINKLKLLLLNNYDTQTMNNCLMVLLENGFNKIILQILIFLDINNYKDIKLQLLSIKNKISGQTLLIKLSQNDENKDTFCKILNNIKDNKYKLKLLNEKDNQNKSCFDYAKPNILEFIKQ